MFATRILFLQCTLLIIIYFYENHSFRLPSSIVPINYDVKLIVFLDEGMGKYDFSYIGSVGIKIKCINATRKVILNLVPDLVKLGSIKITKRGDDRKVLASKIVGINDDEMLRIDLEKNLVPSEEYYVYTEFCAPLNMSVWGFYLTYYINDEGKKVWAAVTQLEPLGIRRVFPTFDDPRFKATYTTSVGHHKRFKALFNMPLESSEPLKEVNNGKDWVLDKFEITPKMATYIFCVFVGDFSFTTPLKKFDKSFIKIWTRPEVAQLTKVVAENTPTIFNWFINYLGNDYPMPKTDLVALPDFASGAMENWGLITFKESILLLHENKTNELDIQYSLSIIAHELAHQWFGNLVTLADWSEVWLNEGFAAYFQYFAIDKIYPQKKIGFKSIVVGMLYEFDNDCYTSTFGLSEPLADVRSTSERFALITYEKGSLIIRMLKYLVGEEGFHKGIKHYLKKYAYSTVTRFDLFNTLNSHMEQGTLPTELKTIMDTWCTQAGYPVVHVKKIKKGNDVKLQISQERFYLLPPGSKKKNECWWIPLTYTTTKELNFQNTTPKLWLSCSKRVLTIKHPDPSASVIFNLGLSGVYKVNYDSETWESLISILLDKKNYKKIDILSRALLIENAFSLAAAGIISYEIPFKLYPYTAHEDNIVPKVIASSKLNDLENYLKRTNLSSVLSDYKKKIVEPKYLQIKNLKYRSDIYTENWQSLIISEISTTNSIYWQQDSKEMFEKWMSNDTEFSFTSFFSYYFLCEAIKNNHEEIWNSLWLKYKATNDLFKQENILSALTCTTDPNLLNRYLEMIYDENCLIRLQESKELFENIVANEIGFSIANSFLQKNIARIYKLTCVQRNDMGEYAIIIAQEIKRKDEQKKFKKFLKVNAHYFTYSKLHVKKALEIMKFNINWHKKYYKVIQGILEKEKL